MPYKILITCKDDTFYASYKNIKHKMEDTDVDGEYYTEFQFDNDTILGIFYHTDNTSFCQIGDNYNNWRAVKASFDEDEEE
jgi:hypothetical protein